MLIHVLHYQATFSNFDDSFSTAVQQLFSTTPSISQVDRTLLHLSLFASTFNSLCVIIIVFQGKAGEDGKTGPAGKMVTPL